MRATHGHFSRWLFCLGARLFRGLRRRRTSRRIFDCYVPRDLNLTALQQALLLAWIRNVAYDQRLAAWPLDVVRMIAIPLQHNFVGTHGIFDLKRPRAGAVEPQPRLAMVKGSKAAIVRISEVRGVAAPDQLAVQDRLTAQRGCSEAQY